MAKSIEILKPISEEKLKLLIAVDMEGISGVVSWSQVTPDSSEWQRFRRIMTQEVNAAIRGACDAGVDGIIVTDGHWRGDNIIIEDLDPRAKLNCGGPSPFSMVQGVDQGVDLAFFIGYHAMVGTPNAVLDHTWSSTCVSKVKLNGLEVGEAGLNAAVCGHFNVPVVLLTGDQSVTKEAQELIPGIQTVLVKIATGRFSAECVSPGENWITIEKAAKLAVTSFKNGNSAKPLKNSTPIDMEIELQASEMADKVALFPGLKRIGGRTIQFTSDTMPEAYLTFRSIAQMAG